MNDIRKACVRAVFDEFDDPSDPVYQTQAV